MMLEKRPVARREDLVVQELPNELLIYDLKIGKTLCLNETSALVWQECAGEKTIDEISVSLSKKINTNLNKEIVRLTLDGLRKSNLLANGHDLDFRTISRREVIKTAGVASAVALPLISSLVAPTAAAAVSGAVVCANPGGLAAGQRVRNGNFFVCTDDCSDPTIGARCCSGTATANPCNCQPGRTTCTCT